MDKVTLEYRAHLVEARQKAFDDFDKTVLVLSGGALGVSVTFIKDLIGPGILLGRALLLLSWACWGTSVLAVLISYYSSQLTLNRAITEVDSQSLSPHPGGGFRRLTLIINAVSGLWFVIGLILFILFVAQNLEVMNVRSK